MMDASLGGQWLQSTDSAYKLKYLRCRTCHDHENQRQFLKKCEKKPMVAKIIARSHFLPQGWRKQVFVPKKRHQFSSIKISNSMRLNIRKPWSLNYSHCNNLTKTLLSWVKTGLRLSPYSKQVSNFYRDVCPSNSHSRNRWIILSGRSWSY